MSEYSKSERVASLENFTGTLAELKAIVDGLVRQHGPSAVVEFDTLPVNAKVVVDLYVPEVDEEQEAADRRKSASDREAESEAARNYDFYRECDGYPV